MSRPWWNVASIHFNSTNKFNKWNSVLLHTDTWGEDIGGLSLRPHQNLRGICLFTIRLYLALHIKTDIDKLNLIRGL